MDASIFTSNAFVHMIQVVFWGGIATSIILIISYFTGNLSHPLVRAMKRLNKLKANCLTIVSRLKTSKQIAEDKELLKAMKKVMRRKKSVVTAINVYIYDDNNNNINQSATNSALSAIDSNCKIALSSIMENDSATAIEMLNETASISTDLYNRFQKIIKKESQDKLFNL